MPLPVLALISLGTLPALGYTMALLYYFIAGDITDRAASAGQMGVIVGVIMVAGASMARAVWDAMDGEPMVSRAIFPFTAIFMVVLVAIMRWSGDFGIEIFGASVGLFDFGVILGAVAGGSVILILLAESRRTKAKQQDRPTA